MSFGIYLGGYLVLLIGLLYGAHLMHIPERWIIAGALVMVGLGILAAVKNTRQKDPS
jgi:cadmium resistance protein CadD (predicted permease)